MTEIEVVELITMIKMYYIKQFEQMDEDELEMMKEFWLQALEDFNYTDCKKALMRHVLNSKWAPTISDLVGELAELNSTSNTAAEAWEKCFKLAIDLPSYDQATWDLNDYDLSEIEIKALRAIGVMNIKMSEKIAVERSNFITLYNELKNRADKENKMPDSLKSLKSKQDLLLEKKKNEQLLLEEKEKQKLVNNALIKANEELDRFDIPVSERIAWLQVFKEKLKAGV